MATLFFITPLHFIFASGFPFTSCHSSQVFLLFSVLRYFFSLSYLLSFLFSLITLLSKNYLLKISPFLLFANIIIAFQSIAISCYICHVFLFITCIYFLYLDFLSSVFSPYLSPNHVAG